MHIIFHSIYGCDIIFHSTFGCDMICSLDILKNTKFDMTNVFHGLEQYSFSLKEGEEELEYTALPSTAMRTELFHLDIVILQ